SSDRIKLAQLTRQTSKCDSELPWHPLCGSCYHRDREITNPLARACHVSPHHLLARRPLSAWSQPVPPRWLQLFSPVWRESRCSKGIAWLAPPRRPSAPCI